MVQNFIIDWVRHAESCANFETSELTDKKRIDNMEAIEEDDIQHTMPEPSRTLLGNIATFGFKVMTHVTDNLADTTKKTYAHLAQKTSQPPLSFKGINQAILLGLIKFNNCDFNYNYIYCSPTARTIMTALFSLRTVNYNRLLSGQQPIEIIIIPCISENLNLGRLIDSDNQNKPIPIENLGSVISYIKNWLHGNYFEFWKDIEFIYLIEKVIQIYTDDWRIIDMCNNLLKCHVDEKKLRLQELILTIQELTIEESTLTTQLINNLSKFLHPEFFKSCEINTTLSNYRHGYISDIKYFYEYIKNTIGSEETEETEEIINILCFSHGSVLKDHFNLKNKLENTEMIREYYPSIKNIYKPSMIEEYNIEEYNETTCGLMCGDPYTDNKMFHIINKLSLREYYNRGNQQHSIDMSLPTYTANKSFTPSIQTKNKYLKYKKKYLLLKNKII